MRNFEKTIIKLNPKIILLINFLIVLPCLSFAQADGNYQIGFSRKNLEPTINQISLSLAGYGLPAEGRFSIAWKEINNKANFYSLLSTKDVLLAIDKSDNNIHKIEGKGMVMSHDVSFKDLQDVTILNSKFYGLNNSGEIISLNQKNTLVFQDPKIFKDLTNDGNSLFAVDTSNNIWKGYVNGKTLSWSKLGHLDGIVSIAVQNEQIIIADDRNKLWKADISDSSIKNIVQIGRENGYSFAIKIKEIQLFNSQLYAINQDGELFEAFHQTDNSLSTGAFIIQKGKDKMIFISLDLCGVNYSFTQEIKKQLSFKYKLDKESIFINSSHTHFAPVTQAWTTWAPYYQEPDSTYLNEVVQPQILAAVKEAFKSKKMGKLYFGRGETFIGINRNPQRNGKGPVDRTLDVVKAIDGKNNILGIIFLTGVHPVFKNKNLEAFTLSANYPSVARTYIEKETGAKFAMFFQGCAGDINPVSDDFRITGTELGKDVSKVINSKMELIHGEMTSFMDSVLIPIKPMSIDELQNFRRKNIEERATVYTEKNLRWVDLMVKRYHKNTIRKELPIYFQTMNLGNWKLFGLSREAVTSYGKKIREIWPHQNVSVAGYSNDVSSYLPDSWHIENKVYEGYESFFWYGQEGIPNLDIQEQIIKSIKMNNR